MKLAEEDSGQIDCIYTVGNRQLNSNFYNNDAQALNYTRAVEVLAENNIEAHISPRYQICVPNMKMTNAEGEYLAAFGTMCMKFIDTEQEKKIDVGVSWPFEKLGPGECLIADGDWPYQTIEVGDKVTITMYLF